MTGHAVWMDNWKRWNGKGCMVKNAGVETVGVKNAARICRGRKRENGRRTNFTCQSFYRLCVLNIISSPWLLSELLQKIKVLSWKYWRLAKNDFITDYYWMCNEISKISTFSFWFRFHSISSISTFSLSIRYNISTSNRYINIFDSIYRSTTTLTAWMVAPEDDLDLIPRRPHMDVWARIARGAPSQGFICFSYIFFIIFSHTSNKTAVTEQTVHWNNVWID